MKTTMDTVFGQRSAHLKILKHHQKIIQIGVMGWITAATIRSRFRQSGPDAESEGNRRGGGGGGGQAASSSRGGEVV